MNRLLIIAFIMTTFFMEGCVSNNEEAIDYFDNIYLPIQEVVGLDNAFQDDLQSQLIETNQTDSSAQVDSLSEEEYINSVQRIEESLAALKRGIKRGVKEIPTIEVYNNETAIKLRAEHLLDSYSKVVNSDFTEMLSIIKKDSISEADNKRFNMLLKQSSEILDTSLDDFYDQALEYGDRYEIDLEFEKE